MASALRTFSIPRLLPTKGYSYRLKQAPILGTTNHASCSFWVFGSRKSWELPESQTTKRYACKKARTSPLELGKGISAKFQKKFDAAKRKSQERLVKLKRKKSATKLQSKCVKCKVTEQKSSLLSRLFGRKYKERVDSRDCNMSDNSQQTSDSETVSSQCRITGPIRSRPPANCKRPAFELQPAAPEAFKLPKAVMLQIIVEGLEKKRNQCKPEEDEKAIEDDNVDDEEQCTAGILATNYKEPIIRNHYEEMRPTETERVLFTCQDGIRAKHVLRPCSKPCSYCNIHSKYHSPRPCKVAEGAGNLIVKPAKIVLNTCPSASCP